ncbi:MAG: triosephosphate isomerase [Chloroflexota bacterium]|nr:triosephosphate isomerase [Chloroflexota bacterium]
MAGNWKMNTTLPEAVALTDAMLNELPIVAGIEKVLCPPFISLAAVRDRVSGTNILVGAQNAYWEPKGAFTGEISVTMLRGLADYVILGHSERRQLFHETDDDVHRKVVAALETGLRVILCVGEDLAINEAGRTEQHVEAQVRADLAGVDDLSRVVIAYEPIWAIGTGRAATPDDASRVIGHIRRVVANVVSSSAADGLRILYGGSVTPENFPSFIERAGIDGGLVGGASLRADSFITLCQQAALSVGS